MATVSEILGPQPVPLHRQLHQMERRYPAFSSTWHHDVVVWTGVVRPHDTAKDYKIRVEYRLGAPPTIDVLEPKLERRRAHEPIPHLYDDEHLCLFLPLGFEWDESMFIADTIIPWATLWLFYYEVWRVTGEWRGGGQHPRRHRR